MPALTVNGARREFEAEPDTPLLWVLREQLGLTGTKYGCGIAACGACTVHVGGTADCAPARSRCSDLREDEEIVTIEGLSPDRTHPMQQAWAELDVPQCGYCQSGQIMAAAALLAENPEPTDEDITRRDDEHLPLRHLQPDPGGHQARLGTAVREGRDDDRTAFADPPRLPRRTTAAAGGFALGFRMSGASRRMPGQPEPRPRSTPGCVIQPDDTVVIRVARHRDGAGHADRPRPARRRRARRRLGEGDLGISDAGPERRPRPGLGRLRAPIGSQGIRTSQEYVRTGRRRGARDAAAGRRRTAGASSRRR